ncbi:MAG: carbohydrate ABC transporter permease [Actinomycetes bacterium]
MAHPVPLPPVLVDPLPEYDLATARRSRRPSGWHLLLLPLALLMLTPLVWMVVTAVSTNEEARQFPPVLPTSIQWSNFSDVWTGSPFGRWLVNTAIVSVLVVISNLVLCSLAGYAFARLRFRGSGLAFMLLLATLMVPFQVVLIPTLLIVKSFGLIDTLGALIVPNLVTAFGIFMMRQFFLALPPDLEEAGRIDGASRLGVFLKILVPLMGPPLATLAVLTFLSIWNDFLWPLVAIQNPDNMTMQLGLSTFQGAHLTDWPLLMAATLMSQLPVIILFLVGQRMFVRSIASSGIK